LDGFVKKYGRGFVRVYNPMDERFMSDRMYCLEGLIKDDRNYSGKYVIDRNNGDVIMSYMQIRDIGEDDSNYIFKQLDFDWDDILEDMKTYCFKSNVEGYNRKYNEFQVYIVPAFQVEGIEMILNCMDRKLVDLPIDKIVFSNIGPYIIRDSINEKEDLMSSIMSGYVTNLDMLERYSRMVSGVLAEVSEVLNVFYDFITIENDDRLYSLTDWFIVCMNKLGLSNKCDLDNKVYPDYYEYDIRKPKELKSIIGYKIPRVIIIEVEPEQTKTAIDQMTNRFFKMGIKNIIIKKKALKRKYYDRQAIVEILEKNNLWREGKTIKEILEEEIFYGILMWSLKGYQKQTIQPEASPLTSSPPEASPLTSSPPEASQPETSLPEASPLTSSPPEASPLTSSPPEASPLTSSPPVASQPKASQLVTSPLNYIKPMVAETKNIVPIKNETGVKEVKRKGKNVSNKKNVKKLGRRKI
jgi:hypothetical protein